MESSLSSSIKSVSSCVDGLSETICDPPAKKRLPVSNHIHWADWVDLVLDIVLQWSDVEGKGNGKPLAKGMLKLSEHNKSLLLFTFSMMLASGERCQIWNTFPTAGIEQAHL